MSSTTESTLDVQARIGVIALTGSNIPDIKNAIVACLGRMGIRLFQWSLSKITDSHIGPLLVPARESYVWVLNIYRRGQEVLFEIGECPSHKMDSLASLCPTHFLTPTKFGEWELAQAKRYKVAYCIALPWLCQKKEESDLYSLASGIHLAYIIGSDRGNHISIMHCGEKHQYYFNDRRVRAVVRDVKRDTEYCAMTDIHYDASGHLLSAIAYALRLGASEHIRAAIEWRKSPSDRSGSWSDKTFWRK